MFFTHCLSLQSSPITIRTKHTLKLALLSPSKGGRGVFCHYKKLLLMITANNLPWLQCCRHYHPLSSVRLRSRLSPGGGQNQKVHFKAKTGFLFIISYKLGANHVKSYKKLDRKAQNLEITLFTMGLGPK